MDQQDDLASKIERFAGLQNSYKPEAYGFVLESLDFTVTQLKQPRHISGQELLEGIREYALKQYGPMARTVFEHWGVRETLDFGKIVFELVDVGLLRKREEDAIDDFKSVYDFEKAFDRKFEFFD